MCSIKAIFDQNGKLLSVEWYLPPESKTIGEHLKGIPHGTKAEFDLKWDSFDGLWFDIPIPFERGDIVCDCFRKEPFVLMGTTPWYWRQNPPRDGVRWRGDSSDMDAQGYGHDADSSFLYDDYRCDVRRVTTINYDRNVIRKALTKLNQTADVTSAKLDLCLVSSKVDYEPPFDVNVSFGEAFEAWTEKAGA